MLTLTNRIDMRPGAVPLVIHLGQYDSDFSLVFELYSSAGNFTVESGTTAMIRGTKTDGNAYDADATINISAKTVTVAGSEQMTAAKGRNIYELVLKKGTKVLSTANFILDVERAAMDADTIASESVLKELNAIIAGAETATEAAANAASAADRAEDAAESVSSASAQIATNTADIADLKADLSNIQGISDDVKVALLACFEKVAWAVENGQDYYDALYDALYEEPPAPTDLLYELAEPLVSTGAETVDTEIALETNKEYTFCCDFIITSDVTGPVYFVFSNRTTSNVGYIGLQGYNRSFVGGGFTDSSYVLNKRYRFVSVINSTTGVANGYLCDVLTGNKDIQSKTYESSRFSDNQSVLIGKNPRANAIEGIHGTIYDFRMFSTLHGRDEIYKYLYDCSLIQNLTMEVGNINATTGQNDNAETRRIRTVGYIPVSGNTITIKGCPFAYTWWDYANNATITTGVFYVRCYDSSKNIIGTVTPIPDSQRDRYYNNEPLPTGTAFIRLMIQKSGEYYYTTGFSDDAIYPIVIDGIGYFITEV